MNPQPIRFLTMEYVRDLHRIAVEDQGGDPSVRDVGLLDSALAMPMQQFSGQYLHETIPAMAAAYAFHICKNHPFFDGNKRAAFASMLGFLSLNAWSFDADSAGAEATILGVADGSISKEQLTSWIASHSHAKPNCELRDFFLSIDLESLSRTYLSLSKDSPGSTAGEFVASAEEATRAMPVLSSMIDWMIRMETEGNLDGAKEARCLFRYTLALYRLAEDQGYEW